MIVAGIDVGSRTTCTLILRDSEVLCSGLIYTGSHSARTSRKAMRQVLKTANLKFEDIDYIVATGYGRVLVPFANEVITEISCHAKGVNWYFPTVRTVLDMGGQDCKAIRVDGVGNHVNFAMNDKCAAGTGRFLEAMAEALRLPLEDIGELSLRSKNKVRISSTCVVFAKSEVVSLMRSGIGKSDILAGVHEAVATRVHGLLKYVRVEPDFAITGGIAKNIGVVRKLEEKVGLKALIPEDPQIVGALGAALLAREKVNNLGAISTAKE